MHGGTDAFVRRSSSCASQTQDRESGSRVVWSHPSCRSPGSADLSQLLTQRALTTEAAGARVCDSGTCLGECLRPSAFPCDPSFLRCVRSGHAAPRADEDFLQSTSLRSRPERRTRPRASFRAAHTTYFELRCPAGLGASQRVMGGLCSRGTCRFWLWRRPRPQHPTDGKTTAVSTLKALQAPQYTHIDFPTPWGRCGENRFALPFGLLRSSEHLVVSLEA